MREHARAVLLKIWDKLCLMLALPAESKKYTWLNEMINPRAIVHLTCLAMSGGKIAP